MSNRVLGNIRIGTDCSGIESPIQALKQLGIPFIHEWACEYDVFAQQSIRENYNPKIIFEDIRRRRGLPDIDLYVAGFPCQPFSLAGSRNGEEHKSGDIFDYCFKVIKEKRPKIFILENVKGLLTMDYWKYILYKLGKLTDYKVSWKVLNTYQFGIPQNRERIYIIGILGASEPFKFPETNKIYNKPILYSLNSNKLRIENSIRKRRILNCNRTLFELQNFNIHKRNYKVDSEFRKHYSATITCGSHIWYIKEHRYLCIKELLSLQGFPVNFKQVVSDTQMKKQIGNSMSVCVLKKLFKMLL